MSNEPVLIDTSGAALTSGKPETPETPTEDRPAEPDWTKNEFPIELFEDRIAIKRDDRVAFTDGGIELPPDARERTMTGLVVGAGPGITKGDGSTVPMRVAVGDQVVFEQNRGMTRLQANGYTYNIMRASDLLGKVSGDVKLRGG